MDKSLAEEAVDADSATILQVFEDANRLPAFFTCTSGELLWGQVHTVIGGSTSKELDTAGGSQADTADPSACSFRFRVLARKGKWTVEAAFIDNYDEKAWHIGFVCHHVDVDGLEVLRKAAEAGTGSGKLGTLEIVSVGRYDWSGSHSPGSELIVEAVEGKKVDPDEESFDGEAYYRSLVYGRFMLVDARGFESFLQALKDGEKLQRENYVLGKKKDDGFGAHVVVEDSEYDEGWMAFQDGELVGFVYDGAYSGLEGENLRLACT